MSRVKRCCRRQAPVPAVAETEAVFADGEVIAWDILEELIFKIAKRLIPSPTPALLPFPENFSGSSQESQGSDPPAPLARKVFNHGRVGDKSKKKLSYTPTGGSEKDLINKTVSPTVTSPSPCSKVARTKNTARKGQGAASKGGKIPKALYPTGVAPTGRGRGKPGRKHPRKKAKRLTAIPKSIARTNRQNRTPQKNPPGRGVATPGRRALPVGPQSPQPQPVPGFAGGSGGNLGRPGPKSYHVAARMAAKEGADAAAQAAANPKPKRRGDWGRRALREIKTYQKDYGLLIRKLPFSRLVKEAARKCMNDVRFQTQAILALQEATEYYVVMWFQMVNYAAIHGKRVTIMQKDFHLVHQIMKVLGMEPIPLGLII